MTRSCMRRWLLGAVASAGVLWAGSAMAQQRVNNGNALDANPRVGSGGTNAPVQTPQYNPSVLNNAIITGNVTDLKAFRGFVPYRDPRVFSGPYAGQSTDQFIRNSSGPPAAHAGAPALNEPQVFYGRGLATAPPPGSVEIGPTGTYVRPPVARTTPPVGSQIGDMRLNLRMDPISAPSIDNGNLMLEGYDTRLGEPTLMTGSPLYGVRQWRPGEMLYKPAPDKKLDQRDAAEPSAPLAPLRPDQAKPRPAPGIDLSLQQPTLPGRLAPTPMNSELRAGAQGQITRVVKPPTEQSPQYASMREKLEKLYGKQIAEDPKAYKGLMEQLKIQQDDLEEMAGIKKKSTTRPARSLAMREVSEIGAEVADEGGRAGRMAIERPQPVEVKSLSTGVRSEALNKALKRAEANMREGKFVLAMEEYETADTLSPYNPLVWLGRAHAELGAAYYARAAAHLRHAMAMDPTLLMGRYDLKEMIGERRLEFLINDLKQIATRDKSAAEPVLLLSYIAYNLGREPEAAQWLNEAQKRAGGDDRIIRLIRAHWHLPSLRPE